MNGVRAEDWQTLEDGTQTYTLEGLLFDHRALVDRAFHDLLSQPVRPHLSAGHLCKKETAVYWCRFESFIFSVTLQNSISTKNRHKYHAVF